VKPVGTVLKLPVKIVGGVVNVVTHAVSSKEKSEQTSDKDIPHTQEGAGK
jgi:hypothetical protein